MTIEPLTERRAKALDTEIRAASGRVAANMDALLELLEEAAQGEIDVALGYPSWMVWAKDAVTFETTDCVERKALAALMVGPRVSQRAIALTLGPHTRTRDALPHESTAGNLLYLTKVRPETPS